MINKNNTALFKVRCFQKQYKLMRVRLKKVVRFDLLILILGLIYYLLCKKAFSIPCITYIITDLKCPLCGATTMCMDLIELNPKQAFQANPLLFIILPILLFYLLKVQILYIKDDRKIEKLSDNEKYITALILILYFIIRNTLKF